MSNHLIRFLIELAPLVLRGQPVVAPSPEVSTGVRPSEWGGYKVTSSFETGYRFSTVGGDYDLYRSNVNYGNGLRLLGSSFTANSTEGRGLLFDSLNVNAQGLGNDPYGIASVRLEKNERYRYDMLWRRSDYYNPFLNNGGSRNLANTRRNMQDQDLNLKAVSWMKVRLGYSRNQEDGPVVSSYELFIGGLDRSVLPILKGVRRDWNEYRVGADVDFWGLRLSVTRQWDFYKDDTPLAALAAGQAYPLANTSVASQYRRAEPMHGRTPGWFGNLGTNRRCWAMNARITYSKGDQDFLYDEAATGRIASGAIASVNTLMAGAGRRPFVAGDFSFSLFPTRRLTIVSNTSAQSLRIDGTGSLLQLNTSAATQNLFWFSYLGTGRVSDSLDLDYRFTNWLAAHAGYQYTERWVDSILTRQGTRASAAYGALSNHLNAGTFGLRIKPLAPLTMSVDAGLGRDNSAFLPVAASDFHTIRARVDYKQRKTRLTATYRQMYNLNAPVQFSYYSSHSRDLTASSSFAVRGGWWLDLSYNKLHLNSLDALNAELPVNGAIVNVRGYNSIYISNVHTVTTVVKAAIAKRATLYMGYTLTRDAGDGRAAQDLGLQNPASAYLAKAQTFPMTYQAPLVRLSVKLVPKLQWNVGWEFYRYNQEFAYFGYQPYYRAQTGYTSVSWAF